MQHSTPMTSDVRSSPIAVAVTGTSTLNSSRDPITARHSVPSVSISESNNAPLAVGQQQNASTRTAVPPSVLGGSSGSVVALTENGSVVNGGTILLSSPFSQATELPHTGIVGAAAPAQRTSNYGVSTGVSPTSTMPNNAPPSNWRRPFSAAVPGFPITQNSTGSKAASQRGRPSFLLNGKSSLTSSVPTKRLSVSPGPGTSVWNSNVYTIYLHGDDGGVEMAAAKPFLQRVLRVREAYKGIDKGQAEVQAAWGPEGVGSGNTMSPRPQIPTGPTGLQQVDGVIYWTDERTTIVSWEQYHADVQALVACVQHPACIAACRYRLQVLEEKYQLYKLCNRDEENTNHYHRSGGGVFSNSSKVDNFITINTMMNAQWLVDYIHDTIESRGNEVVTASSAVTTSAPFASTFNSLNTSAAGGGGGGGAMSSEPQTLERFCEQLDFADPYNLTAESLGLQPSTEKSIGQYDALDPGFNVGGSNSVALLRLFLSTRTKQGGTYLADAVHSCLVRNDLRTQGRQATETVLEFTGLYSREWEHLASWVRMHELDQYSSNQWIVSFSLPKLRDGTRTSNPGAATSDNLQMFTPTSGSGGEAGGPRGSIAGPSGASDILGVHVSQTQGSHPSAHPFVDDEDTSAERTNYDNYQQLLDQLFLPLFMATLAPEDPKYVDLASLLQRTGAIVLISGEEDEEGTSDSGDSRSVHQGRRRRRPADVPWAEPVSLVYLAYFIWANLCSLNALRRRRGLNTLQLRAVASRPPRHNMSAQHNSSLLLLSYLLSDVVIDGVALDSEPVLQYLYGLQRIGVSMCPLMRSSLGAVAYNEHPVGVLLRRGIRVSLCTVNPLYFHTSTDPLLEEYTAARRLHQLSPVDMCELALHSVLMSSFDDEVRALWVGASFLRDGWRSNAPELSNVPTARLELRFEMWASEERLLMEDAPLKDGVTDGSLTTTAQSQRCDAVDVSSSLVPSNGQAVLSGRRAVGSESGNRISARAPYTVLDPAVDYPRVMLVGPYDRDMQYTGIAQALFHALDLRHRYTRPIQRPGEGNQQQNRTMGGLLAMIDPQANLSNPSQSMGWAFRKREAETTAGHHSDQSPKMGSNGNNNNNYLHFDEDEWKYKTVEGIIVPHEVHQIPRLPQDMCHYEDFCRHVQEIHAICHQFRIREFSSRRLELLEHRFKMHIAVNHCLESGSTAEKASQNRDFYQSTKVDNNIRMETGMTARQLLVFIVDKATNNGDDIVSHPKGKEPQTLRQLLSELRITPDSLTVDDLNVQVDTMTGGSGNDPYTPEGRDELLTLLLKTDNQMKGRYFAELTKRTFENMARDRHTFTESRIPVYGASSEEWGLLSNWFDTHGMASSHNQWVVQIPRIYSHLRKAGRVANFAEYLEHIFEPLWRVSLHPNKDPRLFHFVNHIVAFDCVEDERRPDVPLRHATRAPHEWVGVEEPPYNYYLYHLWANISSLNRFRQRRRFSVFAFRPSCGESGSIDHLIGGFLLSQSISYGVHLADNAPLQYLFYLAQIGITLSPLSNNTRIQLNYLDNPFPVFFRRGLRVSLGTDSPLMYHHTQEPLLEEYSIASKIWKLSPNDLSEVARNSVLLSNFHPYFKQEKLGTLYFLSSSAGNDASRTHLSNIRVAYRFETYHTEIGYLEYISGQMFEKALLTLAEEEQCQAIYAEEQRVRKEEADGAGLSALIDATPKEADLAQLAAQRAMMQRQLVEMTTTVSDLHRQNRLLTSKLAEEREKDQQAAQMRRQRVGDKLQELQMLLEQKQVVAHPSAKPITSATDLIDQRATPPKQSPYAHTDQASVGQEASAAEQAAAAATKADDRGTATQQANGAPSERPQAYTPPGTFSSVRSHAIDAQYHNMVANTRRLLEHTEALWSTPGRVQLRPEGTPQRSTLPPLRTSMGNASQRNSVSKTI